MTEAEWLSESDPRPMIVLLAGKMVSRSRHGVVRAPVPEFIRCQTSDRKFRLLAVAWFRRVWHLLGCVGRRVVEVAERQADSRAGWAEAVALRQELHEAETPLGLWAISEQGLAGAEWANGQILEFLYRRPPTEGPCQPELFELIEAEMRAQAAVVRDIFGNPFRPVQINPTWLSFSDGLVVKLAQGIYEEQAFDRMPVLADALEDACCADADILAHLRGPGPHVRGCNAIDALLRKS